MMRDKIRSEIRDIILGRQLDKRSEVAPVVVNSIVYQVFKTCENEGCDYQEFL